MTQPHWTNGVSTLYHADALNIPLPDQSVHCVITSPPYWGLRDYGLGQWQGGDAECGHAKRRNYSTPRVDGGTPANNNHAAEGWPGGICGHCGAVRDPAGIGLEPTLGEWVQSIVAAMREVWRVLRHDGTCWLNLGDAYYGGKGQNSYRYANNHLDRDTLQKSHTHVGNTRALDLPQVGLRPKSLVGQPWRVAFALQDDGWILRSAIVWHKPNPMPESVTDRPTSSYDMLFLLVKSATPHFWTHPTLPGTRTQPEPDYRWTDAATGMEYANEPPDYSDEWTTCPECGGSGEIIIESGQVSMFNGIPSLTKDCRKCADSNDVGWVKRWRRINLWRSHDYYYDAEAVRTSPTDYLDHLRRIRQQTNDNKSAPGGGRNGLKPRGVNKQRGHSRRQAGFNARWDAMSKDEQQVNGSNARNVWSIPTQGRPQAHFATFPDELPLRCILAGTSEQGVCGECGAPWVRMMERYRTLDGEKWDNPPPIRNADIGNPSSAQGVGHHRTGTVTRTLAWQPTCACGADVIPATVLDPFVGSGTTCAVSQQLGRRSVGLDLNPEYLEIARARITRVPIP